MAKKYSSTGVGGITGAGDNTRFRQPGVGPTGGGADGTATATVSPTGRVNANPDRVVDRLMGREGRPGVNEREATRNAQQRQTMSTYGNNRNPNRNPRNRG